MPKPGFYAVRVGRIPGIYSTWADCEAQVKGYPNAVHKKFPTEALAKQFFGCQSTAELTRENKHPSNRNEKQNSNFRAQLSETNVLSTLHSFEPAPYVIKRERDLFAVPTVVKNQNDLNHPLPSIITSTSESTFVPRELIYPQTSKESYYAVYRGRKPGVYRTWTECSAQIKDIQNASYRKFETEEAALEYVRTGGIAKKASKREMRTLKFKNHVKKRKTLGNSNKEDKYVLVNPNETVTVFTDGASAENGKRRARAGFGVYWGPNHPLNTSKRLSGRQTNNRAEIHGAIHALKQAKQIGAKKVKLYTDSQFMIHAMTDWIKKWQENGWYLVTGKKVVNKEDFLELMAAEEGLEVDWIYVKSHAGIRGNVVADRLAVAGTKFLMEPPEHSNQQTSNIVPNACENKPFIVTSATNSQEILPLIPSEPEKKPFYAVHRGKIPGVYHTWTECEKQIKDFIYPSFRKFFSEEEAVKFVKSGQFQKKELKIPECKRDEYVVVFTDGASSSNGKEGAMAGIGVYWGPGNALNTSMRLPGRQTNNRAEIHAAVHALNQAKLLGIKKVRLYTDSKFVINGITTWIHKWKTNGWKLANGKPVINKNDFIALDEARQGLDVDWCYVKGHDNNPGNVEADKLAVAGCSKSIAETIVLT